MMLIIGSFAARIRGVLPAWRCDPIRDCDIIASRADTEALFARFGGTLVERHPGRAFLGAWRPGDVHLDVDLRANLLPSIIGCSDNADVDINGEQVRCAVARPELILALRMHLVPHSRAKALRDIEGYAALGITVSSKLKMAARAFARRSDAAERDPIYFKGKHHA